MSQITISRRPGGYTDRLRKYHVFVDGAEVGQVGAGHSVTTEVDAGRHEVQLTIDWATSPTVTLDLDPAQTGQLYCEPAANPLTALYYSLFARQRYITLRIT
ncbi:hypothetical protein GPX89_15375 [Nocardia sp. ET3-3]|uniref:PEGA domain-containing protein n=1 Tax=Nocardia terrae TaxID=2675851 RepID=A0A7K1UW57_9NOCA|nr:hypothetical protein [Nocardia terrae]MVU78623.1 hypothetical protein [Nocardia terrae]